MSPGAFTHINEASSFASKLAKIKTVDVAPKLNQALLVNQILPFSNVL